MKAPPHMDSQPKSLKELAPSPGAGFDQPFEMLSACHERVQRSLALMQRLQDYLQDHANDAQSSQAARDVMRYFDLAAPHHHEDEERHIFPLLRARGDAALLPLVQRLSEDHQRMGEQWALARAVLAALAESRASGLSAHDRATLAAFAALYDGHIEAEEQQIYPAAQALMDAPTLAAAGQDMAARRGVPLRAQE